MVLGDVDGGAEDVVRRAAQKDRVGHPVQPQERLMERFVGELGRSQAPGQLPNETA
jgi:hypothetical protein